MRGHSGLSAAVEEMSAPGLALASQPSPASAVDWTYKGNPAANSFTVSHTKLAVTTCTAYSNITTLNRKLWK